MVSRPEPCSSVTYCPLIRAVDFHRRVEQSGPTSCLLAEDQTTGNVSNLPVIVKLRSVFETYPMVFEHLHGRAVGEEVKDGRKVSKGHGQESVAADQVCRNVLAQKRLDLRETVVGVDVPRQVQLKRGC